MWCAICVHVYWTASGTHVSHAVIILPWIVSTFPCHTLKVNTQDRNKHFETPCQVEDPKHMILQGSVLDVAWEATRALAGTGVWVSQPRICQECCVGTSAFHTSPYLLPPRPAGFSSSSNDVSEDGQPSGEARENIGSTSSLVPTWPGQAERD